MKLDHRADIYAMGLVLNIGLNRWLIPTQAGGGAAVAMLGSELALSIAFVLVLRHLASAAPRLRVIGAAGAVVALGILIRVAPGATDVYLGTLIFVATSLLLYRFTGVFGGEDIAMLRAALRPSPAKGRAVS